MKMTLENMAIVAGGLAVFYFLMKAVETKQAMKSLAQDTQYGSYYDDWTSNNTKALIYV
jgi:hypothetical protein